ncbi:two-component system regulatory protein YycI [Cohnella fermenti]|uniref:Regulatory protein YycH-like domain-containing protein n=1 Tax=Cohnella fermenti TaxID=2565925 RepID=A0A4V3WDZ1_9BACL|nr:two-component system regulatory protein YycI [Cohnella fermenti]THF74169.1 hypothetical protein E6C55_26460 [Cohnella fermenti]
MDWGRAKSVLILAFLLLNLVLGYQLWLEWRERIDSTVDWTSLPAETQQTMNQKGIRVDAEIPTETPEMLEQLSYSLKENASGDGSIALDPQPNTRVVYSEEELEAALGTTIPELGLYQFDYPGSRDGVYVFNRMFDGWPIFDIKLELAYSDQKITGYRQDAVASLSPEDSKRQKALPATMALVKLIASYLPAGATIHEIQLGYHGQIFDSEIQLAVPTWRFLLDDGETYYVNAISGEVVTDKEKAGSAGLTE